MSQSRLWLFHFQFGSSSMDEQICIPHHCVNSFLAETVDKLPELAILCLSLKKYLTPCPKVVTLKQLLKVTLIVERLIHQKL